MSTASLDCSSSPPGPSSSILTNGVKSSSSSASSTSSNNNCIMIQQPQQQQQVQQSGSSAAAAGVATNGVGGSSTIKYGTLIPNRIFVGGISSTTTEADLHKLFSTYGNVKATKIISDRGGCSKGYGFVTFETEDEAKKLQAEADNIMLKDRKLNIAPAIKKIQTNYPRTYEMGQPVLNGAVYYHNGIPYTYQNGVAVFAGDVAPSVASPTPATLAAISPFMFPPSQQQMFLQQQQVPQQAAAAAAQTAAVFYQQQQQQVMAAALQQQQQQAALQTSSGMSTTTPTSSCSSVMSNGSGGNGATNGGWPRWAAQNAAAAAAAAQNGTGRAAAISFPQPVSSPDDHLISPSPSTSLPPPPFYSSSSSSPPTFLPATPLSFGEGGLLPHHLMTAPPPATPDSGCYVAGGFSFSEKSIEGEIGNEIASTFPTDMVYSPLNLVPSGMFGGGQIFFPSDGMWYGETATPIVNPPPTQQQQQQQVSASFANAGVAKKAKGIKGKEMDYSSSSSLPRPSYPLPSYSQDPAHQKSSYPKSKFHVNKNKFWHSNDWSSKKQRDSSSKDLGVCHVCPKKYYKRDNN